MKGSIFLTSLAIELKYFSQHKYKRSFLDALNLISAYRSQIKTQSKFFIYLPNVSNERQVFLPKTVKKSTLKQSV